MTMFTRTATVLVAAAGLAVAAAPLAGAATTAPATVAALPAHGASRRTRRPRRAPLRRPRLGSPLRPRRVQVRQQLRRRVLLPGLLVRQLRRRPDLGPQRALIVRPDLAPACRPAEAIANVREVSRPTSQGGAVAHFVAPSPHRAAHRRRRGQPRPEQRVQCWTARPGRLDQQACSSVVSDDALFAATGRWHTLGARRWGSS